ncbi:MMPL family transporter [Agromyces sp. LHK192]|uniref:MMPL family transporter n=1 Tax=Agromyces sp. LHK192 TaxID=2498704 RepID=UPI000FD73074|nr:MMPL family transporter [Agromyces sp. LHK192]
MDGATTDRSTVHRGRRVGITIGIILVWVVLFLAGGRMFSQLNDLGTNDRVQFLPDTAESTQVDQLDNVFRAQGYSYAVAVFTFDEPLDDHAAPLIERRIQQMPPIEGASIFRSTPLIVADDRLAAEFVVPVDSQGAIDETVSALRSGLTTAVPDATAVYITGGAGFAADIISAFSGIDGLLLLVALGAVLLILIIVYRSPLLPLIVLFTSLSALCGAVLVVAGLARTGAVLLAGQTQGILLILVVGASTNYALLYVSRYTEALASGLGRWDATTAALRGTWKPILASGATVIAALMVLLLSELGSNRTLGPIASIGIVFAMLASFTLLPALLLWAGRAAFWPRQLTAPRDPEALLDGPGVWPRLARFVAAHHRKVWIGSAALLVLMSFGLTQLKADGAPSSEYVLGQSQARDGLAVLAEHYPAGSGTPAIVVVEAESMLDTTATILAVDGVDHVRVATLGGPTPVTPDGVQPFAAGSGIALAPMVVEGDVLLEATLTDAADTRAAEQTVRELRSALDALDPGILVGGQTAIDLDANEAASRDRGLIVPAVLLAVLLVLVFLLRSLIAPVIVIGSVALSYAAALGVSALVFQYVLGFTAADPTVPLFAFVFLIALGVDYNIFLMTRAREETPAHGARDGMLRSLILTGGVITSAGIVLAATFAALGVLPLLFLAQIAFIVAFGVLLDTFLVRTLLVPALVYDLGRRTWWPGALSRARGAADEPPDAPVDPSAQPEREPAIY